MKQRKPQISKPIYYTIDSTGCCAIFRTHDLKQQQIADGGGEGCFESKEEHDDVDGGSTEINEIDELDDDMGEVACKYHPLASPEVSEAHPHN